MMHRQVDGRVTGGDEGDDESRRVSRYAANPVIVGKTKRLEFVCHEGKFVQIKELVVTKSLSRGSRRC